MLGEGPVSCRKQAEDKFSKGNIEEAMDLTNPEEEEFEMRVRNGTLPTKAVMYHIRKNKTEDKRAGYKDTRCPRCGRSKEDQFHVFVKCPWNVRRNGGAPLKTSRNALLNFAGKCGRKEMRSG